MDAGHTGDENRPPTEADTAVLVRVDTAEQSVEIPSRIPLNGESIMIGRGLFNHVIIPDRRVSRAHAELTYERSNWHIVDKSMNGISVNGSRLKKEEAPSKLENGDLVQLVIAEGATPAVRYRVEYASLEAEAEAGPSAKHGVKDRSTPRKGTKAKAPASSNITGIFQKLQGTMGVSDLSDEETEADQSDNIADTIAGFAGSKVKLDEDESNMDFDNDCIILEDNRDKKSLDEDIEVVAVVDLAESPAKLPEQNSEERLERLKLMEEIVLLRRELEEVKSTHQKESEELATDMKLLESEVVLQQSKRVTHKLDLINYFLDLKCFTCKAQCIEPVRVNPCGHLFCGFCIKESFKTTNTRTCPRCGVQVEDQSSDIVLDNLISEGFTVMPPETLAERQERITQRSNADKTQEI